MLERGVPPKTVQPPPDPEKNVLREVVEFLTAAGEARRGAENPRAVALHQYFEGGIISGDSAPGEIGIITFRHEVEILP